MSWRTDLAPRDASIIAAAGLLAGVLLAHWPALHGGLLWDDDIHLTGPELPSVRGLGRIWFEIGATPQYYPVLHSLGQALLTLGRTDEARTQFDDADRLAAQQASR